MIQYELFDGQRYLFSISPRENPIEVYHEEARRYPLLRAVMVEDGVRTPVVTSSDSYDEEDEECDL